MIPSLIILAALVVVGLLLYLHHRITGGGGDAAAETDAVAAPSANEADGCCGMHITCERDSLLAAVSPEIVYYDDEELDAYTGRPANDYTSEETEQFRDILLTLLPDDIAGWARSLQMRGIELPNDVREELLLIVSEERIKRSVPQP